MALLSREHPKVEQGGWFLLLCLEKPMIEALVYKVKALTTAPRFLSYFGNRKRLG